jgi:predicted aspartyl protease
VDTGADITVLPEAVARRLRLPRVGHINVAGFSGSTHRVGLYAAQVDAGGASQIVEVIAVGREAIVGRNLLNRWRVTLDGPSRVMRL